MTTPIEFLQYPGHSTILRYRELKPANIPEALRELLTFTTVIDSSKVTTFRTNLPVYSDNDIEIDFESNPITYRLKEGQTAWINDFNDKRLVLVCRNRSHRQKS